MVAAPHQSDAANDYSFFLDIPFPEKTKDDFKDGEEHSRNGGEGYIPEVVRWDGVPSGLKDILPPNSIQLL
jgi:hypothetical protein